VEDDLWRKPEANNFMTLSLEGNLNLFPYAGGASAMEK
jgi:hypothetical protein